MTHDHRTNSLIQHATREIGATVVRLLALSALGLCAAAHAQEAEPTTADPWDVDPTAAVIPEALVNGTGILPAAIVVGLPDPNGKVPALNAVPGAGESNLSVAFPTTILTHGTVYTYLVSLEDVNVTGNYEVDYLIQQVKGGKTVTVQTGMIHGSSAIAPGQFFAWATNGAALPNAPGIATLIGRVRWGTGFNTQALVKSTVLLK